MYDILINTTQKHNIIIEIENLFIHTLFNMNNIHNTI